MCDHCVCKKYHNKFENEPERKTTDGRAVGIPDDCWCGHEEECHSELIETETVAKNFETVIGLLKEITLRLGVTDAE